MPAAHRTCYGFVGPDGDFPRAAFTWAGDAWMIHRFTDHAGCLILAPCSRVPAADPSDDTPLRVAFDLAMAEDVIDWNNCARC